MTLRKLCNHPDLVTNDYSDLVTCERGKIRGAPANKGARKDDKEEEDEGEFVVIPSSKRKRKNRGVCLLWEKWVN